MYGPGYGGHMAGWDGGWWFMGLHGLFSLVLLAALVLGVAWLARHVLGRGAAQNDALKILERRYAEGDIERDDYLQRRRDLEGVGPKKDDT